MTDAQTDYEGWQASRQAYLTAPTGNIALVAYQGVDPADGEQPIEEWPATVWRVGDEAGVHVRAQAADGVRLDGELVDGEAFAGRLQPSGSPLLTWGSQSIDVFSLDGTDYELRRYDAGAEALANFQHVEYYDYDPALRVRGILRAREGETDRVPWEYTRAVDAGHTKEVPGLLEVTLAGQTFELLAFADSGVLVLTFADATTGRESYAPGRFLKLDLPGPDGVCDVDFNRTIIPPCGFSDFFSCPLPPPQNRLPVPVRAGEKTVVWARERHH